MGFLSSIINAVNSTESADKSRPDFVVVDLETTGFGKNDRIIEVAAVVLHGETLDVIDQFDTLLNPVRDIGATDIHGITASMVEFAPTFEEISVALSNVLDGKVLVAHNISFESRFLEQEFERIDGEFDLGLGICTLKLSGEKLATACSRRGIQSTKAHRALSDARATAELLTHLIDDVDWVEPIAISGLTGIWKTNTVRRDAFPAEIKIPISKNKRDIRFSTSAGNLISYLDVLDTYLDDLILSPEELEALSIFAGDLGISSEKIFELHEYYLQSVINSANRDGRITEFEHEVMVKIADALGLPLANIPKISEVAQIGTDLNGLRVCFTGEAVVEGENFTREKLEAMAANAGLQPVASVTKSNCDLVVAADKSSMSTKSKKAIAYGIPMISVAEFIQKLGS